MPGPTRYPWRGYSPVQGGGKASYPGNVRTLKTAGTYSLDAILPSGTHSLIVQLIGAGGSPGNLGGGGKGGDFSEKSLIYSTGSGWSVVVGAGGDLANGEQSGGDTCLLDDMSALVASASGGAHGTGANAGTTNTGTTSGDVTYASGNGGTSPNGGGGGSSAGTASAGANASGRDGGLGPDGCGDGGNGAPGSGQAGNNGQFPGGGAGGSYSGSPGAGAAGCVILIW